MSTSSTTPTSNTTLTLNTTSPTELFDRWLNIFGVAVGGGVFLIICCILTVALRRCYMRKKFSIYRYSVDVQVRCAVISTMCRQSTIVGHNKNDVESPIYCEVEDIFFKRLREEQHTETSATVPSEQADTSVKFGNISEREYSYPKNTDEQYESPPEANGEYSWAYDYLNVNTAYMNTFPRENNRSEEDYEYIGQTNGNSSADEYRYAYDWAAHIYRDGALRPSNSEPLLRDSNLGDNVRDNRPTSRKNVEDENKTASLKYVKVL